MKRLIKRIGRTISPHLFFSMQHLKSSRKVDGGAGERDRLFKEFLSRSTGPAVQISIKNEIGKKFGPNWTSIDKYDNGPHIDRHDDIENLQSPDGAFEAAVCWSVLEHVPHPHKAIAELHRVLRPGGLIWVQLPFLYPYHQSPHHD